MLNIRDEVAGAKTIGITGHIRPDGDSVGASCALALYIRKVLPQARIDVFLESGFLDGLRRNIPGADRVNSTYETDVESYDVFIVVDTEKQRTGRAEPLFDTAKKTINIDHHVSSPGTGDVCYIDGDASSACELVYNTLDPELIDREIAQALYVGMVTDTGVFRYSATTERTMQIAGRLMSYGFNFPRIVREVFFEKTFGQQIMTAKAIRNCELGLDGRLIVSVINYETLHRYGAVSADLTGISTALVSTAGVDCAILLTEREEGRWKASMRSNEIIDVARLGELLGGGGHVHAAGATFTMNVDEAMGILVSDVRLQFEEYEHRSED